MKDATMGGFTEVRVILHLNEYRLTVGRERTLPE
jgi:hypothetical protein